MKNILGFIIVMFIFAGCEKIVELKYKSNQSRIVIEGNITNEPGPWFVKISRSIGLSDTGRYPTINNASVSVTDNAGNSEVLTSLGNGLYRGTNIQGIPGRIYTLIVNAEGNTYTARSTMPVRVPFDSVKVTKVQNLGEIEYSLVPKFTDPAATGNNYHFILAVNGNRYKQHLLLNDELKNGVENSLRLELNDNEVKLKQGDSIELKMQCIDKTAALYYTTLILMVDSGPGGATTPNNPPGNFSHGALGLFSAHTTETRTTVVQ